MNKILIFSTYITKKVYPPLEFPSSSSREKVVDYKNPCGRLSATAAAAAGSRWVTKKSCK